MQKAGICFLCLKPSHCASDCKAGVQCSTCGDECHSSILHKDKDKAMNKTKNSKVIKEDFKEAHNIKNKCTTVCQKSNCRVLCSKIMLVDTFNKNNPSAMCCVYELTIKVIGHS